MSHSPLVRARRTAGLATACGALLIAGLSAPASGQVADDDGYFETDIDSGSYASGPGSCAVLSNPGGTSFELSAGETVTDSSDESLAVEYSDDASDTQSLRVRGTSTASWTTSGGGLRAAGLTSEATISGSAALGDDTACRTYLEYENYLDIETSVPSDGFIELSLHTSGDGRGEIGFYQRSTGAGAALNSGSGGIVKRGTVASSRTFVEAGRARCLRLLRLRGEPARVRRFRHRHPLRGHRPGD